MISTETHTVDTTNTATVDVSANTATSTVDTLSAVTTSTNDATEIATTADATTAESTTTSDPTTSVSAPEPFETFDVLAIGGSIDGQYMKGVANEATMMGWDLTGTGIGHMPLFTIEPVTNYAKVLRNDLYLCIGYEDGSEPNFIASCDLFFPLPALPLGVQCVFEPDTVRTPTGGDFDQFYTYSGRSDGPWLAIDSSSDPPTDSTFQPIELGITPNESKLGL
ncbi:hypothetical protein Forpe1208_v011198 [Fusarium oxysporum f. sp. rapae]|uniref:Uncharacterized protein n=1 Tax=Fusarium oxysporum f. sp. rapae TaxID=485398 RepID=A0A8J5NTK0_FUSOX|nr:hypothetical protein Forpe1208_v011198 [Fusarium oxysporum f. sp. rapae]